ncbi:MAG: polyhydroxyalkanoate synthesis regulator DNA-binding domain-containing protein [Deltaproteobacteria bacterium]|nr:polyhydroxyalkanoate synthesis regulator DNA-binding domain-containing protein [Deltaproteobacteria bacterium]
MTNQIKKTRIIKRYQNRKLYDTSSSRYVTLDDIADLIRQGEDVQVVDNQNRDDLTSVTLTQIIFEQEKKKKSLLPLSTLRGIIQSGGERIVDFVQSSIESGVSSISHARDEAERYIEKIIKKGDLSLEEGRHLVKEFIDEKLKTALDAVAVLPSLHTEIRNLRKKIDQLEEKLKKYEG